MHFTLPTVKGRTPANFNVSFYRRLLHCSSYHRNNNNNNNNLYEISAQGIYVFSILSRRRLRKSEIPKQKKKQFKIISVPGKI